MRKTKTSTAVKQRWNAAHYDKLTFSAPKGWKTTVQTAATGETTRAPWEIGRFLPCRG